MDNTNDIKEIITSAGKLAMTHFLEVTPAWKDDKTYVTQADFAVQEYLHGAMESAFPDDGIVAEENDLRKPPRGSKRYWVIDPIDGTASFSAGLPIWGVSIALVDDGHPLAGFFYIPVTRDLFHTGADGRVYRNDRPMTIREPGAFHRETSLFIASRLHRYYTVSRGYPGKLRNLGSSVAHLAYVATGSADAALVERVYVWDIAAGMAMLQHNGGVLRYVDGSPIDLTVLLDGRRMPLPALGGHPRTVNAFLSLISYRGEGDA